MEQNFLKNCGNIQHSIDKKKYFRPSKITYMQSHSTTLKFNLYLNNKRKSFHFPAILKSINGSSVEQTIIPKYALIMQLRLFHARQCLYLKILKL